MLCALFSGVFRYVDQHFYTPETFLENTSEMADNADIREFLFQGFRTEIIQLADGDIVDDDSLGTVADRLDEFDPVDEADPVTQERIERDQAIEEILLDVFDSELYDSTFSQALRRTQSEVVRSAELESAALLRDKGEIFFNMRPLYETLYPRLADDPRTAAITSNVLPDDFGIFKVADRDTTISALWTLMQKGPGWRGLMTLGAVLSFIGAVAIADRRPSTAIQFGSGMVGVAVVLIVLIMLIRFIVPLLAGGASASPVVATYATNVWPLIRILIRMAIFGAVIAAIGGVTRFIWPDNWVYSSVSDERGVRSIKRRRGEPEPVPQQPQRQAAAVPVGYQGYPQQPYGGYPPQWGQPYPGQYPPGYAPPYPVGPYAQPAQPMQQQQQPQHYTSPGQPTVPVMPVKVEGQSAGTLVPPEAPPFDAGPGDLPADAAQVVPRVVATADTTLDASTAAAHSDASRANATIVEPTGDVPIISVPVADAPAEPAATEASAAEPSAAEPRAAEPSAAKSDTAASDAATSDTAKSDGDDGDDEWATEKDW